MMKTQIKTTFWAGEEYTYLSCVELSVYSFCVLAEMKGNAFSMAEYVYWGGSRRKLFMDCTTLNLGDIVHVEIPLHHKFCEH